MLKSIPLGHGHSLCIGIRLCAKRSRRWLVHLPESGAGLYRGHLSEAEELVGPALAKRLNYLVINKRGIGPGGKDRQVFESAFRREQRIKDALTAMHEVIPKSDKIYLIGYSEGAYLAPQIARRDPRVRAITLIAGGTRGWLSEELNLAEGSERTRVRRQIRRILKRPDSEDKWNGFSHATWCSYQGDHTLRDLRRLRIPVLAVLGGRDRTIDVKTTLADLKSLKRTPTRVHLLPQCGHSFSGHWADVRRVIRSHLGSV